MKQIDLNISEQYNTIFIIFLAFVDVNKESIVLQKGETIDYRWIPSSEINKFLSSDLHVPGKSKRIKKVINI